MARKVPEINAGSMADISFLLLIFFLVTTTMDVDSGIVRRLPPPPDPTAETPDVKQRNVFNVLVNKSDRLFVESRWGDISTLRNEAKEFLSNPQNREDLPEKRMENIPGLGEFPVSKGIISLKNDRGTSYDMYIQVQNELTAAVNELRDELSRQKFGVKFADLRSQMDIDAIQAAVPMSISEAEPENIGGGK
ncbi:MAG: biopolymer transporter ExbD [Lentimicrobium sp.]|jgi:biopolymer transport protein ExbD|nr:biopolymer transporter ExbD [Lentimicrobium sp.]